MRGIRGTSLLQSPRVIYYVYSTPPDTACQKWGRYAHRRYQALPGVSLRAARITPRLRLSRGYRLYCHTLACASWERLRAWHVGAGVGLAASVSSASAVQEQCECGNQQRGLRL